MDKIILTYTMLKKYKDLDSMIENLNRSITNKAINSYYLDVHCGVERLADSIIDLIELKGILQNIKLLIRGAVEKLDAVSQQVFTMRFVNSQKTPTIAEKLGIGKMQAYRIVQSMPKKILPYLEKSTYFEDFCNTYNKIAYIKSAYEQYSAKLNKSVAEKCARVAN